MDLTILTYVVLLALASIGVDTAMHPASVVLDSAVPNQIDKLSADANAINQILRYEVDRISSTPSVLAVPEITVGASQGIGMAIAQAANMGSLALALQAQLGYQHEQIKLTLLNQDGKVRMLVNGAGPGGLIDTPPFQMLLTLRENETLPSLVHRAAVASLAKIDPYMTALHLLQNHVLDGDFTEVEVVINEVRTQLPPTPISYERSLFENLQGIINLFQRQPEQAQDWFVGAARSDPTNLVAVLNAGFVGLYKSQYRETVELMRQLLAKNQGIDRILLATAYVECAGGLLALHDLEGADRALARATEVYPESSVAYELWSTVKRAKGDVVAADRMHRKALERSSTFANYAEVAALYFAIPWREGMPLTRNPFVNPGMMHLN